MTNDQDIAEQLQGAIRTASESGTPLFIRGGGSKAFYGRPVDASVLEASGHQGIVNYEPTELVLTARAGTPLSVIEDALAAEGQMMPFEPPDHGGKATLGGAFATGLSGPARLWRGSARDHILGMRLINGRGDHNRYGGEVMKNVAGYDVSRLVTGAMGTLGLITEISMKVLPRPEAEIMLVLEKDRTAATVAVENWYREGVPISGASVFEGLLHLRISGAHSAVEAARGIVGGEEQPDGAAWWSGLRHQTLPFFRDDGPLWRISLPPSAGNLDLGGDRLFDWNGQLRWLRSNDAPERIRDRATHLGGHATLYQGGDRDGMVFQPLAPALLRLNRQVKAAFDPKGIFNPGRMYPDF